MALTVVKYRKTQTGETTGAVPAILVKSKLHQQQTTHPTLQQIAKKPMIKLDRKAGIVINKIPSGVKPTMKRSSATAVESAFKAAKYSVHTINSAGTPLTTFDGKLYSIQQATPGGTTITAGASTTPSTNKKQQQQISAAIGSLPPNTIIQATTGTPLNSANTNVSTAAALPYLQSNGGTTFNALSSSQTAGTTLQVRRPTIYIKREAPKRTIRSVTLELIEKNPYVHLGVASNRLPLLKNIVCKTSNVSLLDLYITLKKLRQNEDFALLGEYFELTESEVQQIFTRNVVKLARYLRFLVRWPDSKKYYDRHKNLPFAFRSNLSHVQSLIDCVETDMQRPSMLQIDCNNFKFILTISTNGIISYVSDAYVGHHDDLTIFNASNFQSVIPKYLSLVADPGKAIRRKRKPKNNKVKQSHTTAETDSNTDSADESADDNTSDDDGHLLSRYAASRVAAELASHQTLNVVNSELTSRKVKDFSIPTMRVREPVCRLQIRHMIYCLREFKILQPYAIQEPLLYQYLNEILTVSAALTNLQR